MTRDCGISFTIFKISSFIAVKARDSTIVASTKAVVDWSFLFEKFMVRGLSLGRE